jgi:Fe-S oxidoreductase
MNAGTMCPSYRATKEEQHLTRGRANILRLAISGQLGRDALTSPEMKETMDLCVSCKGCKRDCPTGVDMARMEIEFLHHYHERHGLPLKEKLIAHMPRSAHWAAHFSFLMNLRDQIPGLAKLSEKLRGFSARRTLPKWHRPWKQGGKAAAPQDVLGDGRDIVLFGDTFNRYFERENLEAAERVLKAAGYRIHTVAPPDGRSAADGPISRRDRSRTRARKPCARSRRWNRSLPVAHASSACNPPASSPSVTR